MENNFFEYLIVIFFIVSILQAIFGKKKKKGEKQSTPLPRRPETRRTDRTQGTESAQDILEQILGFKIPKQTPPQPQQNKIPADINTEVLDPAEHNQTTWNPEEEYKDPIGVETIRYENKKEEKPSYQAEMAKLEKMAKRSKKSLKKLPDKIKTEKVDAQLDKTNKIVDRIKRTVHNPETLREYIIVSEILSKPKALRR